MNPVQCKNPDSLSANPGAKRIKEQVDYAPEYYFSDVTHSGASPLFQRLLPNVERMDGAYDFRFGGAASRRSMPRFVLHTSSLEKMISEKETKEKNERSTDEPSLIVTSLNI